MSEETSHPPFQAEAVNRILERFASKRGPRRYLVADEVGLGKTHVAREVMRRLRKKRGRRTTVLYICSNTEVAAQNQQKLDRQEPLGVNRLTLAAPDLGLLQRSRDPLFLSLTPGTSLYLTRGDGTVAERALIYILFRRLYPHNALGSRRASFRGRAGYKSWRNAVHENSYVRLPADLKRLLRQAWSDKLAAHRKKKRGSSPAEGENRQENARSAMHSRVERRACRSRAPRR